MKSFLISTVALALLLAAGAQSPARAQGVATNSDDYTINLPGADGKNYDLSKMQGQVILVSFGATWCQPCKDELRALEQLKEEYRDKPVKFFWVSIEPTEQASDGVLKSFARSVKFTFPILRDASRWTYAQFSTRQRIPLVVFFDKQGRFVAPAHAGMPSTIEKYKQIMRGVLDRLLADQTKTSASKSTERMSN